MGDLRAELLAAFEAELAEHLAALRGALRDADAGRPVDLKDASRRAHSLKGAARAVEQPQTEAFAHEAETLLLAVEAGERTLDPALAATLRDLLDRIQDSAAGKSAGADDDPDPAAPTSDQVRVSGDHLERLARSLRDLSIQAQHDADLDEGFDALEAELIAITRLAEREGRAELAGRLSRLAQNAAQLRIADARRRDRLDRVTLSLEHDAEHMLLSPVDTLFDGYERMVREIAASQGKAATLRVEPSPAEADRRILQALREPLLHLLRNAVSHGIEPASERATKGKPEAGEIRVETRLDGGQLTLDIVDDGRGLDYRAIERRARAAGLIAPGAPRPPRHELRALLFAQGFSTAEQVDAVSGRGLGLSVVAETARRLHGTVAIAASAAGGTRLTLSVPAALTRQPLVFVEAGGERYAVPAAAVERLIRVEASQVERGEGADMLAIDGEPVPVALLADLVGAPEAAPPGDTLAALLVSAEGERRVLVVDALVEVRALIVGDPTAIAADAPLVFGTVEGEGGVIVVLSPQALAASARHPAAAPRRIERAAAADRGQRTVLVVDDSITTRTLEKTILEGQGYRVLVSVDGLAALELLRSGLDRIDLVVADVEMPRMDGFALLTAIRNDPSLKTLPVVMMTSRNQPEDIDRGLSLGADAYVTKQEFDQGKLISVVQQLI